MGWEITQAVLQNKALQSSMGDILASIGPNPASVFESSVEVTGHAFANILGHFARPAGVAHSDGAHEGGMAAAAQAIAQAAAQFTR